MSNAINKLRAILAADQHHLASSLYDPTMSSADGLTYGELRELAKLIDEARAAVGPAWFTEGQTLADAIREKCAALEEDIAESAREVDGRKDAEKRAFVRQAVIAIVSASGDRDGSVEYDAALVWKSARKLWEAKPDDC